MRTLPTFSHPPNKTFSQEPEDITDRAGSAGGYILSRPRLSGVRWIYNVEQELYEAEGDLNTLNAFIQQIGGGSDLFNWKHPFTGAIHSVRFDKVPEPQFMKVTTNGKLFLARFQVHDDKPPFTPGGAPSPSIAFPTLSKQAIGFASSVLDYGLQSDPRFGKILSRAQFYVTRTDFHADYAHMNSTDYINIRNFIAQVRYGSFLFSWTHPVAATVHQVRIKKFQGLQHMPTHNNRWRMELYLQEVVT